MKGLLAVPRITRRSEPATARIVAVRSMRRVDNGRFHRRTSGQATADVPCHSSAAEDASGLPLRRRSN